MSKRMVINLTLGAADCVVVVDGASYSPDVLSDMLSRAQVGLRSTVELGFDQGVPEFPMPVYDDSVETLESLLEAEVDGDTE